MVVAEQIDAIRAPYEEALAEGRVSYQRCADCANAWLPPRGACPACLGEAWYWQRAKGSARLISWVVYHRAYDPSLEDRVPYPVLLIELSEGPRLIAGLEAGEDLASLRIEAELELRVDAEHRRVLARTTESNTEGEALPKEEEN
ncbi:MAG: DNA-binding protein [Solirubrobacterales bacterium]|nr:DNA-binding protein [Solirubrobacterales bacterium]